MAFRDTLTPIQGGKDNTFEVSSEFINMKFGELLENDIYLNDVAIPNLTAEIPLANGYDLDNFKTKGKRTFNATCLHLPSTDISDGCVEYIPYGTATTYGQQKVLGFATNGTQEEYTRLLNNSVWGGWKKKTITSNWTATSSNLANTWTAWGGIYYPTFTRIGTKVFISNCVLESGTLTSGIAIITNIPQEYRPSTMRIGFVTMSSGVKACCVIGANGVIQIDTSYGVAWTTGKYIFDFNYDL